MTFAIAVCGDSARVMTGCRRNDFIVFIIAVMHAG